MIEGLDHIAIAVTSLDASIALWEKLLGATCVHREIVAAQRTEIAMLRIGDVQVELIAPTDPESPVANFLAKRGPGLHHVALKAADAQQVLDRLTQVGAALIDAKLRPGAEQTRVGFVHPKTLDGVLIEIVEHPASRRP